MPDRPRVLIEQWLPIAEIGAECMRERGASSALPPLYFLHVWWARRPLTVSRAAILASLLPAYPTNAGAGVGARIPSRTTNAGKDSPDGADEKGFSSERFSFERPWPKKFLTKFPSEETYHAWFLKLIGIHGDPVAGRKLIAWAKTKGIKLKVHPYGYARAFTVNPTEEQLNTLYDFLEWTWGTREITFCDPMAGGGSIPFEALRYGLTVHANELNPVASVILKATLDYPARFGPSLADDIRKYGKMWCDKVRQRLEPFYPLSEPNENIFAYLWARTVACPVAGKPVPLSPNWWLRKSGDPIAVKVIADPKEDRCRFEIVKGKTACENAKPDQGTIKGGTGRSPWTGEAIDGDYIKAEAQAGRMGEQLFAVGHKNSEGLVFRRLTPEDYTAWDRAVAEAHKNLRRWTTNDLLPSEELDPISNYDRGHRLYGAYKWLDFFSPRQQLALAVIHEELGKVLKQLEADRIEGLRLEAITTYLGIALDKCVDYNCRFTRFDGTRNKIANKFDKHNYAFKWSYGEFDASRNLLPWTLDQVIDSYTGMAALVNAVETPLFSQGGVTPIEPLRVSRGRAQALTAVPNDSIRAIVVDPPYYDNVQYAECSDFFYVWMKRSLAAVHGPLLEQLDHTSKDDEAVANPARFASSGKSKKVELAEKDYENKMAACFREMHRVLSSDGTLTVMFTHKRVEAWDTLGNALLRAGFHLDASWPVQTESEHSTHQAKKGAAASTILLVCRRRDESREPVWWDDLKGQVRRTAREAAERFEKMGITGVDLYISTFGPVLSIISENWPVLTSQTDPKTGDPMPLRPGDALDLARAEVVTLRKQGLLLGRAVDFDPVTDWVLMAWDAFKAVEFPADEARKLALALGLDLEASIVRDKKLVAKKQSTVVLNGPTARRKKGMVDPDADGFTHIIDAVHTAMMVYDEDGAKACGVFLDRQGLQTDSRFKACIEALMKAIPTTRDKKNAFVRPEMETLEALRLAFFDDLPPPKEEEIPKVETQGTLFAIEGSDESAEVDTAEEDEDD